VGPKAAFITSATLTAGENFITGGTFTPASTMTCLVTVSVQVAASSAEPAGPTGTYLRTAMGSAADGNFGHYLLSTGQTGYQPDITRTSVWPVSAGVPTSFGAYLGGVSAWAGSSAYVQGSYACS
jgi:hypothetical protein